MQDASPNLELDESGFRRFALTMGGITAGLFGFLLPWLSGGGFPLWPWILASILVIWGLVAPSSLRPVHRGWTTLGLALNKVMSPLMLTLVYFLVVTPMGMIRRLMGHGLPRHRDAKVESYRIGSRKAKPEELERPF